MAEPELEQDWSYPAGQGRPGALRSEVPVLSVEGFEGPLDFLLDMVRRRKLDLGPLSLVDLTDQFLAAMAAGVGRVPLERRSEWLVMASDLVLLKARLVCPESPAAAEAAEAEASRRLGQLEELACMRAAAAWLTARPQLGIEVFGRGQLERQARPQAELYVALLEAMLAMLVGKEAQGLAAPPPYRPTPVDLWRVPDALEQVMRLVRDQPDGIPMEDCLPVIAPDATRRRLRFGAALASTLVASLELARDASLAIEQGEAFGAIKLRPIPASAA